MRALTIRQPWVWAISEGIKRIENRAWTTPYRGDLVIHAGRSRDDMAEGRLLTPEAPPDVSLVFGSAVCVVRLADIVPLAEVEGERFASGPWCWLLEDPRPIEPIPAAGRLRFFDIPDRLIRRIERPTLIGGAVRRR